MEQDDTNGPRESSGLERSSARPHPMLELEQPRPKKRSYASFLEDPAASRSRTTLDTRVSRWLDSVDSGVESRSESGIPSHRPAELDLPDKRPKSAPEMGQPDDVQAAGAMLPPLTPSVTSAGIRSQSPRSSSGTSASSVGPRSATYRRLNLERNGIFIESLPNDLPKHINDHVAEIKSKKRDSPEPTPEAMAAYLQERKTLDSNGVEADVTTLMQTWVLPRAAEHVGSGLQRSEGLLLSSHLTPAYPGVPPNMKVSQPKPDLVYGYSGSVRTSPFSESQLMAQQALDTRPGQNFVDANTVGLQFPFFALELKADAGTFGTLWVAANQCAGDAAACLNAAERLNDLLQQTNQPKVDNLTYCLAMDNRLAQLYVSWKPDRLQYYMYEVGAYRLAYEDDFKEFRRHVRNIIDWGKDKRLQQIREALDVILEEDRKEAAKAAKARPPPSVSGSDGGSKRRRSSGSAKGGRA